MIIGDDNTVTWSMWSIHRTVESGAAFWDMMGCYGGLNGWVATKVAVDTIVKLLNVFIFINLLYWLLYESRT